MTVHVYGVTAADAPTPEVSGRQGGEVRLITQHDVAAIVSDVDAEPAAGPKDLLAHAHVLEWLADRSSVLPMRFGIALPADDDVREHVLGDRDGLAQLLATFDGLVQLTVQAFHREEPALREVLRRAPELVVARDELKGRPQAATRSAQLELGEAVAAALGDLQDEDRLMILDRLAPLAQAVAEHDTAGEHEVAHTAYLVERSRRGEFDDTVATIGRETEERLRFRYVGPQPPYSFLEAAQTGELAWA